LLVRISLNGVGILVTLCLILPLCSTLDGQVQPPSESLLITTDRATTWNEGETVIILTETPTTIETDRTTLKSQRAVLWISPAKGSVLDQQTVEIALIGDAELDQPQAQLSRRGDRLFVTTSVRGSIRIAAQDREARDLSETETYRAAARMRPLAGAATQGNTLIPRPWIEPPPPAPGAPIAPP
jgi:hypothetical protein